MNTRKVFAFWRGNIEIIATEIATSIEEAVSKFEHECVLGIHKFGDLKRCTRIKTYPIRY